MRPPVIPIVWSGGDAGLYPLPGDRVSVTDTFIHEAIVIPPARDSHVWVIHNAFGRGVRLDPFERFSHGRPVQLITRPHPQLVPMILRRAFSRLGKPYSLLGYNCQDFVADAFTGVPQSHEQQAAFEVGLLGLLLL